MHPEVDTFINNALKWQPELQKLRSVILSCGLTEELKWDVPVYTYAKRNIVGMNGLKESCALSFFKGGLLQDADGLLIKPGEHTQTGRWLKFTDVAEITRLEATLRAYIYEAIEVEKAGVKMDPAQKKEMILPAEFQEKLDAMPALKTAFNTLTPGRKRAYYIYFSAAKQAATRQARVEKYIPQILAGKGLKDQ